MMFHFCGNPMHDIVHNSFVLLSMMPEWLPFVVRLKLWASRRAHVTD
jgi:hypothetical protein